jgi:hypothetical protein
VLLAMVGNSNGDTLSRTQTNYVGSGQAPDTSESVVAFPLPSTGGNLTGFQVQQRGGSNSGGGTQSYTYTLMRNGTAVAGISCQISENSTSCSSAGSIAVAAGDVVSLRAAPSGNPTARSVTWAFVITPP